MDHAQRITIRQFKGHFEDKQEQGKSPTSFNESTETKPFSGDVTPSTQHPRMESFRQKFHLQVFIPYGAQLKENSSKVQFLKKIPRHQRDSKEAKDQVLSRKQSEAGEADPVVESSYSNSLGASPGSEMRKSGGNIAQKTLQGKPLRSKRSENLTVSLLGLKPQQDKEDTPGNSGHKSRFFPDFKMAKSVTKSEVFQRGNDARSIGESGLSTKFYESMLASPNMQNSAMSLRQEIASITEKSRMKSYKKPRILDPLKPTSHLGNQIQMITMSMKSAKNRNGPSNEYSLAPKPTKFFSDAKNYESKKSSFSQQQAPMKQVSNFASSIAKNGIPKSYLIKKCSSQKIIV